MFTDANGVSFSVALQPYGDALAVFLTHPQFNGGNAFAVTGCSNTPGAFESAWRWAEQFERDVPSALRDLDNNLFERSA